MKLFTSATAVVAMGLSVASVGAVPLGKGPSNTFTKRVDCVAKADIIRKFSEDALQRYRVAFSISRPDISPDDLELSCPMFKDQITKCTAVDNNIACYFSGADQSWVIDNNQVVGVGDPVEDCLVMAFRDRLADQWGCHL